MRTDGHHLAAADKRQQILSELSERAGQVIDEACEQIFKLRTYRRLTPEGPSEVQTFATWVFHLFLDCLGAQRGLSSAETMRLADVGRNRLDRGVDVEDFAAAFDLVYSQCHAMLVTVVGEQPDSAALVVLGRLSNDLSALSRAAVLAVANGFEGDVDHPHDPRQAAAHALLEALLTGLSDRGLLTRSAAALGIASESPLDVVIAVPGRQSVDDVLDVFKSVGFDGPGLVASPSGSDRCRTWSRLPPRTHAASARLACARRTPTRSW